MYVSAMKTESHSFLALQDFGRKISIPKSIKTDNAKTEAGRNWTDWCCKYMVSTKFTEAYHPWQIISVQGIGDLSRMMRHCMRAFNAPLNRHGWCQRWCCKVRNCCIKKIRVEDARGETYWNHPQHLSFQISFLTRN